MHMTNNIIKIIKQYLRIDTNYAVIINGDYGIGKTYCFKNLISPAIKEISVPSDDRKKYLPIHISLFGINSIEDLQLQIFLSLYPLLKNEKFKLAMGVGKSIIRGITKINKLGDIDKYIADIDVNTSDWINYSDLVICLDDLDRKARDLNIEDIFGYINNLVENQNAKIIIIANDNILNKVDNYTEQLKEKVIGVSIQYSFDVSEVFDSIVKERYENTHKVYFNFLKKYKSQIINVVKINEDNLRNLIFFLEHFKVIYYPLVDLLEKDKDFKTYHSEKLEVILMFSLSISFEYKKGKIKPSNFADIRNIGNFPLRNIMEYSDNYGVNEKTEKTYAQIFKEKYFKDKRYYYLDSIFNYIIGKSAFIIADLKNEINEIFTIIEGKLPRTKELLEILSYYKFLELTPSEYSKYTKEMILIASKGSYPLSDYLTVFHYATRFDNLLGYSIPKLKDKLKKGINKGKNNFRYDDIFADRLNRNEDYEFKNDMIEIFDYCLKCNNDLKKISQKQDSKKVENLLINNFPFFINTVTKEKLYDFYPYWNDIPLNKVYMTINKLDNIQIMNLSHYFRDRYNVNMNKKIYSEVNFLIDLKAKINFPKKRKTKNLRNATLNNLVDYINVGISNINDQKDS